MTKEEYLLVREKVEIPKEVWFEYYKERGGKLGEEEFWKMFVKSIFHQPITLSGGRARQTTFHSALQSFYSYYNSKFDV